ncbi:MAG TPA: hypothetical protein VHG51_15660 [Longimicrobiaceae bacterium]|nr:hypothetical protein [Longimicrobiaceae bacterium]
MHASAHRPLRRAAVLLGWLLAACSPPPQAPGEGDGARVEADVFSGLPNPAWELDASESGELARRFRGLAPAAGAVELHEGLGYRGFVVTGVETETGGCERVRVQGGAVQAACGGETRAYVDPERALERWLARTAEGRAEPEVVRRLREETGG